MLIRWIVVSWNWGSSICQYLFRWKVNQWCSVSMLNSNTSICYLFISWCWLSSPQKREQYVCILGIRQKVMLRSFNENSINWCVNRQIDVQFYWTEWMSDVTFLHQINQICDANSLKSQKVKHFLPITTTIHEVKHLLFFLWTLLVFWMVLVDAFVILDELFSFLLSFSSFFLDDII